MKTHKHILDTEKGVFGFMYLMDEIKRKFFNDSILTDNNYQDIEIDIKNTSEDVLSTKTIGRAFDYRIFFTGIKPSNSTLDILTRYFTKGMSSNFKFFIEEIKEGYLKEYASEYESIIDRQKTNEEEKLKQKIPELEKNTEGSDFVEIKQTNIIISNNSSIIRRVIGKISQSNFFAFGNKQEVNIDNGKTKK